LCTDGARSRRDQVLRLAGENPRVLAVPLRDVRGHDHRE
jgi:hypothetical protein